MLKNELHEIEKILSFPKQSARGTLAEVCIESQRKNIFHAWQKAAFSEISEHTLVRYFHYHLEGISKLSDTLFHLSGSGDLENLQDDLLSLIDHIKIQYPSYFNDSTNAPVAYRNRLLGLLMNSIMLIRDNLEKAHLNNSLKSCMLQWLAEMSEADSRCYYSFRSLAYFKNLVNELQLLNFSTDDTEDKLINLLSQSNFNHLAFFAFRQGKIRDTFSGICSAKQKLEYLLQQRACVLSCPYEKNRAFDNSWPSLKIMMGEWLNEEIRLAEKTLPKESVTPSEPFVSKVPVDLSVAHLSCLIRLLFEESVFATQNLTLIFKAFAGHYQTKRQAVISPGSLSKEFYSIDQHTAARVRDLLQRMINRINRNFFPVVVAASIAIHVYQGMR